MDWGKLMHSILVGIGPSSSSDHIHLSTGGGRTTEDVLTNSSYKVVLVDNHANPWSFRFVGATVVQNKVPRRPHV